MILYHGSQVESFTPTYGLGNDSHDYGRGFYTTADIELGKEWAVGQQANADGWLHAYEVDLGSLKVFDFDISAVFDYQLGGKIYDNRYMSLMGPVATSGNGQTYHKDVMKSWSADNTGSNIPRWQYSDAFTASRSTRFLTSATYLNFQSFTVGYTLPQSIVKAVSLSRIRIYCQGENIYFWSKRKGLDPRYSFAGTNRAGVNAYSPARTIMGGIQVSF